MYNQYPYTSFNPNAFSSVNPGSTGLLGSIAKKAFNWDGFLNNTQRTLNVINQAMPIYNQVKPMFRNMGTVFKVIGELNRNNSSSNNSPTQTETTKTNETPKTTNINNPQFFV